MPWTRSEALGRAVWALAEAIQHCVLAQGGASTDDVREHLAGATAWLDRAANPRCRVHGCDYLAEGGSFGGFCKKHHGALVAKPSRRAPLALRDGPLAFACSQCSAEPGRPCVSAGAECTAELPADEFHAARKRSAGRRK